MGAFANKSSADLDRLARQPRDLKAFLDLCDEIGLRDVLSVAGDGAYLARVGGDVVVAVDLRGAPAEALGECPAVLLLAGHPQSIQALRWCYTFDYK